MSAKAVRETLGFLGVVISLVFVGLEVQQNNKLARGPARQDLAELNQEWLVLQSQDFAFNAIYTKVWGSDDEITDQELSRGTGMMTLHHPEDGEHLLPVLRGARGRVGAP